jgi:putative nucleotidyltransferase with HDIG domain
MARLTYRLKQAWRHLRIAPHAIDRPMVAEVLPAAALGLFNRMSQGDQAHACCVLAALRRAGPVSSDLAQAALLHDVGKAGAGLSLAYRTLIVILRRLALAALHKLGEVGSPTWRRPFYLQRHHATIGARMCESVGCSPRVVQLVAAHDLSSGQGAAMITDVELAALCTADDSC